MRDHAVAGQNLEAAEAAYQNLRNEFEPFGKDLTAQQLSRLTSKKAEIDRNLEQLLNAGEVIEQLEPEIAQEIKDMRIPAYRYTPADREYLYTVNADGTLDCRKA